MRTRFQTLRRKQFDRSSDAMRNVQTLVRPAKGWIRAVREAAGISASELARKIGTSRQLPLQLEKAEAEDRITLKSLRTIAEALDCELVYALVPKAGSMQALVENRARAEAREALLRVEHSMAIEDQAAGSIDDAIEEEARRILDEGGSN